MLVPGMNSPANYVRDRRCPRGAALLSRLPDVVPAEDAISQLSGRDGPADVGVLVGTGGVGAARTFELSAAADRSDGLNPALGLLHLGHLDTTFSRFSSRVVDGTDIAWRLDCAQPAAAQGTGTTGLSCS
jgi:hypothetical protein